VSRIEAINGITNMRVFMAFSLLALTACVDPAETCASYGYTPGTEGYAFCQMQVSQQNADRRQRTAVALNGMTLSGQQSVPNRTVTCRPLAGGAVQCY
jgi:hypothetical protein